jgi:hypothetical protein
MERLSPRSGHDDKLVDDHLGLGGRPGDLWQHPGGVTKDQAAPECLAGPERLTALELDDDGVVVHPIGSRWVLTVKGELGLG